jgi:hypothetical protein
MHRLSNGRSKAPKAAAGAAARSMSGADNSSGLDCRPRRVLRDKALQLRIEDLERQANFGLCAFMVLGDLLSNVRSNGGMTAELIDNTFAELVTYFEVAGTGAQHPIVRYVQSMWRGDSLA